MELFKEFMKTALWLVPVYIGGIFLMYGVFQLLFWIT